ncbi:MAG: hypothetical protein JW901_01140 [Dehalococcoidia bacterium]|nr:hypothetical protein [Dehalococcoidia bacterium]
MLDTHVAPRYQVKDDALHLYSNDEYYEWWYLDAQFDNGYSCVAILHYRFLFITPHTPSLHLNIYSPDGNVTSAIIPFGEKDVVASADHCDVKFGGNFLRYENGIYRLSIRSRRAGAELIFKNTLPGWRPPSQELVDKEGLIQDWIVPVPRAEVEGALFIGNSVIKVKGNCGYHDHNWGNCNMWDYCSHWYRGRLYHEKYTIIYTKVYPMHEDAPQYTMFYLAGADRPLVITRKLELKEETVEMDTYLQRQYAKELIIAGKDQDIELNGCITTKNVVDKVDMSDVAKRPIYYCRFLADYNAELKTKEYAENLKGQTLYEFMCYK